MNRCYNYSKLLGKIRENGITQKELAKAIGSSPTTLSLKLNNKSVFSQSEIDKACGCLGIAHEDVGVYFFAH
ncbi:MAG: DUF739 family protein [Ruminococcaceae bacterium]|nr:DUF739 family protein [Oscillospiraceae bacterium]